MTATFTGTWRGGSDAGTEPACYRNIRRDASQRSTEQIAESEMSPWLSVTRAQANQPKQQTFGSCRRLPGRCWEPGKGAALSAQSPSQRRRGTRPGFQAPVPRQLWPPRHLSPGPACTSVVHPQLVTGMVTLLSQVAAAAPGPPPRLGGDSALPGLLP